MPILTRFLCTALLGLAWLWPTTARAAQSYDNCTGFIDSVPATITTQGTWCLRKDLATAITSGNAITIATNNVTIDCNHFKLGGLAAGDNSGANGIRADNRLNATVRHCNVRGFHYGILLNGGGGHLLEDNRLDQNLHVGIHVSGDNNTVRRNAVYDTGGYPESGYSFGIFAEADVIDNTVAGVFASATNTFVEGIRISRPGNEVRGNRVRGLMVAGSGFAVGIIDTGSGTRIDGNHVSAAAATSGWGIYGNAAFCGDNTVARFSTPMTTCQDIGGNASN